MANSAPLGRNTGGMPKVTIERAPSSAKLVLRGRAAALKAMAEALELHIDGVSGGYVEQGKHRALWLGPDEWLLKSPMPANHVAEMLEGASAGLPHAIVDVSSTYTTLRVAGEGSEFLINHGCPLDLSLQAFGINRCTRTLLGKTEIILSRVEHQTFEIDVTRSFTDYMAQFLRQAYLGPAGSVDGGRPTVQTREYVAGAE
jgi:sarcosine oxidase, subunit gamma